MRHERLRPCRAGRVGGPLLAVAAILASGCAARADHHLEKRALMEIGMHPGLKGEASRSRGYVVVEIVCGDAKGRRVTLVCGQACCLADLHGEHAEDDEP